MRVDKITKDWLRENLGWQISESEIVHTRKITPSNGLTGRIYQIDCTGNTLILKCPPSADTIWNDLFLNAVLIYREIQAYKFLAGYRHSHRIAPRCYWSMSIPDKRSGALSLEYLTNLDFLIVSFPNGLNYEHVDIAIRSLVTLHSLLATTDADPLSPPYSWMCTALSERLIDSIKEGLKVFPRVIKERLPKHFFRQALSKIINIDVRKIVAKTHIGTRLISFCHSNA